ncbi:MAG: TonB-dependent receptor [Saprospiraceae bacterium]|nr:TonB-dependent receptor [Saprospiraceae bacterium]
MKNLYLLFLGIFFSASLLAQDAGDKPVNIETEEISLIEFLNLLTEETEAPISFSRDQIPTEAIVSGDFRNQTLKEVLTRVLPQYGLNFRPVGNQLVIFEQPVIKQNVKWTIGGYIEDETTGERLIGANIFDLQSGKGTTSNNYGFFSLTLDQGPTDIVISYLGYQPYKLSIDISKNILGTFNLKPSLTLGEIVITANRYDGKFLTEGKEIGVGDIKSIVSIGGESDLFRTVLMQPGVQSGAEGIGGLNVRGGSNDQNLVLLDDVPVYVPQHTWGVYSIFNTSAIQNARFYKDGFPSRYSGRLSSVLDVRTRDGNKKEYEGELQLGLVSSKITYEGPILKDKASFLFSARRSITDFYSNIYYRTIRENEPGTSGTIKYYFYDLNLKFNYAPTIRDKFFLSLYNGQDTYNDNLSIRKYVVNRVAYFDETKDEYWGNKIASFRWNHTYSNKLFSNTTLTFSRYDYISREETNIESYHGGRKEEDIFRISQSNSNIRDLTAKIDFEYFPEFNHKIKFGLRFTNYRFQPGVVDAQENSFTNPTVVDSFYSIIDTFWKRSEIAPNELGTYIEDQFELFKNGKLAAGLHVAMFMTGNKNWYSFEPRIRFSYSLNKTMAAGAGYEKMTQFLHLLSTGTIGLPTDIWVSATDNIHPQRANQYSLWWQYKDPKWFELSANAYYKKMRNLLEFVEGSTLQVNASNWESSVVSGVGDTYGLELALRKSLGATKGWVNYAYAHANRQFDDINSKEVYPFRFDRRHVLNIGLSHEFAHGLNLKANWTYSTGLATSLPGGLYINIPGVSFPPLDVLTFESVNGFRMPNYHFLDIGGTYSWEGSWGKQSIEFGLHNIYLRKNPIFYEIREENRLYQRFLPPLLPSFSYIVKI